MDTAFDPTKLPPSVFDDRIRELETQVAALEDELTQVTERLDWWRKGRALFGLSDDILGDTEPDGEAFENAQHSVDLTSRIVELIPSTNVLQGQKPRLRQAILRTMLDRPSANGRESRWPAAEIIADLTARDWMPNGKNAENMVRHMLRDLVKRGQLVRPAYGTYALAPNSRRGQSGPEDGP